MEPRRYGSNALPAGDPGFMVVIEVDRPLPAISSGERLDLSRTVDAPAARLEESVLGNARVVFHVEHCSWPEAGRLALRTERKVGRSWPTVGLEICRADLWAEEPFFDHEPDGLGDLPDWCAGSDPRQQSTVVVEVEPAGKQATRVEDSDQVREVPLRRDARSSRSSTGRLQRVFEEHSDAGHAAHYVAKPAFSIAIGRSITRIRCVRSDIYRAEVAQRTFFKNSVAEPQAPEWHFATDEDGDRLVVVIDLRVRLEGWSLQSSDADGTTSTSEFALGSVWVSEHGIVNTIGDGRVQDAWQAPVAPGSHVDTFLVEDRRLQVDPWDSMDAWLVESFYDKPLGFIVELGPNSYIPDEAEEDDDVVCAQVVVLDDDVMMLRRSRTELGHLLLADYSSTGLRLDTWHHDDRFDDCTDGYLFTRDIRLVARTCVAWFRDNVGMDTSGDLGCSYRFADELPRHV